MGALRFKTRLWHLFPKQRYKLHGGKNLLMFTFTNSSIVERCPCSLNIAKDKQKVSKKKTLVSSQQEARG